MTIGPEQRAADFNSQQAAYQKNAEMRGLPYTTQPRTDEERAQYLKYNPPAEPTLEQIHRRLNAENVDLRGQLELSRKATSTAQELLEAERQKNAQLETALTDEKEARASAASSADGYIGRIKELRLLRTNDAATIADLERRLREAEGQLKALRRTAPLIVNGVAVPRDERGRVLLTDWERAIAAGEVYEISGRPAITSRGALLAENAELRRTIGLMAKTAAEVQDNFRLIAELAADPADEKRKEPKP